MKFTVTIDCDNAAFTPSPTPAVAQILTGLALALEARATNNAGSLYDINGNRVGEFAFLTDAELPS